MASLIDYMGLQVLDGTPTGQGGRDINDDLKLLVDWNPKSKWDATNYPSVDDDESESFQVGSNWFAPDLGLFTCVDSSVGEAVWQGVPIGSIGLTATAATTNATQTQLLLPGSNPIVVAESSTWAFEITTVGRRTDSGSDSKGWLTRGAVKRVGSTVTQVGSSSTSLWQETASSSWAFAIAISGTQFQILVTGESGKTIKWTANVRIVRLSV